METGLQGNPKPSDCINNKNVLGVDVSSALVDEAGDQPAQGLGLRISIFRTQDFEGFKFRM